MNMKDTLLHYSIMFLMMVVVAAGVNKLMQPKKETTFDVDLTDAKIKELRDQMLLLDKSLFTNKQAIEKIKTKIDTTNERIIYIKQNRYINNSRISNLNSNELVQLLSNRYKDSIR